MSRREVVAQTTDEHGDEQHPAFGMIGASRVSSSPPGATLFDSDIRHQHTVTVRIATATRRRDLNHGWLHRKREFVEVEMSEAQWASFVSSEDDWNVPGLNYESLLRVFAEAGGVLTEAQLNARVFMGHDYTWGDLRQLADEGKVECGVHGEWRSV
jgi:hypothetical protein